MGFVIDHIDIYMMIAGGMAIASVVAFFRQDGPSTMAMAFAALLAGHLAKLPADVLVPCCALVAVVLIVVPSVNLLLKLSGRTGSFWGTAVLTGAIVTLSATPAAAAGGLPDWDALLGVGRAVHQGIDSLTL
jgi:hypothetical protein